ncbi:MAG: putative secreted protein [uncultured Rubrobacteraceae bacterium]|uniref:Putative secreted protein n=1 Tax=uncultured Rubrobacteraceae bacterium TaxID=349277 RepID=A0A6J4QS95_9ACTN|nr:MAG: putative secreted protein [uncultured Rubrobacteraceae bacterium]
MQVAHIYESGRGGEWRHAVVVGAGMGGLISGRVLAGYFDRVTILERDVFSPGAHKQLGRKGVPQGRHLHSLAARGSRILERYFPGLDDELAAAGCPLFDQAQDFITDTPAGRLPRFRSGITMRAASRALLEERLRHRLEEEPNVRLLAGSEVLGLTPGGNGRIAGVRIRQAGGSPKPEEVLYADLVVDASGQGSRAPRWLEEIGYHAPTEEVVDARLGYATRWFEVPEGFSEDWESISVLPGWPDNPRGGTLRRVEGGVWTAVLIGLGGDYPPTDGEAFLEFARSLPSPAIHDAIKSAEPVSPVYGYRRTANRRRLYEKVRLPEGFLVTGDAACSFNPSYGSGMTAVALSAEVLDECLREQRRRAPDDHAGLGRRFHERQATAVAPCWTLTANSDRQWSVGRVEELGPTRRLFHGVSGEVMALAVEREDVARTLLEVKNLLEPPSALLRPGILLPALRRTALSHIKPRPTSSKEPGENPRPSEERAFLRT